MILSELKTKIINKSKINLPLIFINDNNDYLIKSYINQIAKNNQLTIREISSINEMIDIESGMFKDREYLYIYKVKKDDLIQEKDIVDYNIILISDSKIDNLNIDSVEFKKLDNWQIEAYISKLIPGLNDIEISWLCKNSSYDLNRLENEADKLNIFEVKDQKNIFKQINEENGYCDLNELTIFNLSNAILKKDIVGIKNVVKDIDYIDVEAVGLVTILLKNFLNIINIQTNARATPYSLGMSEKQFNFLRYNQCNKYSNEQLFNIYNFLTDIDYRLKSGLLDMSNNQLNYYIISKIIGE